MFKITHPLY